MGADIHGFVEHRPFPKSSPEYWETVINVGNMLGRNYEMFGLLFGVRNYSGFNPIAPNRGFPKYDKHQTSKSQNRIETLREHDKYGDDGHSVSWITLEEINKIDWTKTSDVYGERIHVYDSGDTETCSFTHSSELSDDDLKTLENNHELKKNNKTYRLEKTKYFDALSDDWKALFDMMRALAKNDLPKNIRLVVWFDS